MNFPGLCNVWNLHNDFKIDNVSRRDLWELARTTQAPIGKSPQQYIKDRTVARDWVKDVIEIFGMYMRDTCGVPFSVVVQAINTGKDFEYLYNRHVDICVKEKTFDMAKHRFLTQARTKWIHAQMLNTERDTANTIKEYKHKEHQRNELIQSNKLAMLEPTNAQPNS